MPVLSQLYELPASAVGRTRAAVYLSVLQCVNYQILA